MGLETGRSVLPVDSGTEGTAGAEIFLVDAIQTYIYSGFPAAIEEWFAYILALGFLVFRPQGLFGEKIIERV